MGVADGLKEYFTASEVFPRIYLEPDEAHREHVKKAYRHHVIEIPCFRAFGLVMIALFVLMHNLYLIPISSAWPIFWRLSAIYAIYIALSWTVLLVSFRKVPKARLGLFFLLFDIILFLAAIYYSGGEKSWLFFLLMVRTADQTRTSWRNTLLFANVSTLGYVLLLVYLWYFEHRKLSLPAELTIVGLIYASNIYLSFVGKASGYLRNRLNAAMRMARDLIRKLEAQSKALESSERDYRALVEGSIQGVFIEQQGIIQMANLACARIFGYEAPDALIGLDSFTLVASQQDRDRLVGLPAARSYEYMGSRRDGTSVWVECLVSHITWRGEPAILATLQDITARKEAEEVLRRAHSDLEARVWERTLALQEANDALRMEIDERKRTGEGLRVSEERYRLLMKNIPGVVFRGYSDGPVEFFDDKIQGLIGYPAGDFASGKLKWPDLVYPEDLALNRQVFLLALQKEREYVREYRLKQLAGDYAWLQERSQIICGDDGRVDYVSGVLFDITERKREEDEKQKLEKQLLQAQKMEAVGRLAGGVAHDFNNMLSVILGYTELALTAMKPVDPLYKNFKHVREAANRSVDLTRQLLAFSRRQTISPRPMDLNEQTESMKRLFVRIIGEDIDLIFRLANGLWPVYMDPTQIDQIFANLVINARDAMPEGGKLTVETANITFDADYCRLHPESRPDDFVMLAVSDTGCGMDKQTLEHVFEPFFTTKPEGKGTGLGLATIYGIVKQNRGFVDIYSEPGLGTTVRVYIPRCEGEKIPSPVEALEESPGGGWETVLLVEDETEVRRLSKTVLEWLGYRVLEASGPGEALALCEKYSGEIHLLLTDVVMPNMNGQEMAEKIKGIKPGIKTIFMSGYTTNAVANNGLLENGTHFLQKPFSLNTLAAKVREVLDKG